MGRREAHHGPGWKSAHSPAASTRKMTSESSQQGFAPCVEEGAGQLHRPMTAHSWIQICLNLSPGPAGVYFRNNRGERFTIGWRREMAPSFPAEQQLHLAERSTSLQQTAQVRKLQSSSTNFSLWTRRETDPDPDPGGQRLMEASYRPQMQLPSRSHQDSHQTVSVSVRILVENTEYTQVRMIQEGLTKKLQKEGKGRIQRNKEGAMTSTQKEWASRGQQTWPVQSHPQERGPRGKCPDRILPFPYH